MIDSIVNNVFAIAIYFCVHTIETITIVVATPFTPQQSTTNYSSTPKTKTSSNYFIYR